MKLLKHLWYGDIDPSKNTVKKDSYISELFELRAKKEKDLIESLDLKEREDFKKYQDCEDEISEIYEYQAFENGFKLGARIIISILQDEKSPFVNTELELHTD